MKRLKVLYIVIVGVGLLFIGLLLTANRFYSAARLKCIPLNSGNLDLPNSKNYVKHYDPKLKDKILSFWSSKAFPESKNKNNLQNPRIVLSCFITGKKIDEANRFLMQLKPHGITGSTWGLNPHGDYDFTLMALTPILYFFGDSSKILYPETRQHLLDTLLTAEGSNFDDKVPRSLGSIEDTENHVLMTQGSRHLKNRWLRQHGNNDPAHNNQENGIEEKLASYLEDIIQCGIYEFNSNPYQGYTLSALLNLNAFGGEKISRLSATILDRMNGQYALGSYDFRRFAPFRRRYDHADDLSLNAGYHVSMMKTWISFYADTLVLNIDHGEHMALWAAIMPYRPPDEVVDWTLHKKSHYLVRMGHGWNSSPEIYSGSPDYLLSAGGVNRGNKSMIVARPTTLIFGKDPQQLSDVFNLAGPGVNFKDWNNTGVCEDFAVAAGPVVVPASQQSVIDNKSWQIFHIALDHYLAIFSNDHLGIMAICQTENPTQLADKINELNPDKKLLQRQFHHPNGHFIEYDTEAPKNTWVIKSIDQKTMERNLDNWPFFDGNIHPLINAEALKKQPSVVQIVKNN